MIGWRPSCCLEILDPPLRILETIAFTLKHIGGYFPWAKIFLQFGAKISPERFRMQLSSESVSVIKAKVKFIYKISVIPRNKAPYYYSQHGSLKKTFFYKPLFTTYHA